MSEAFKRAGILYGKLGLETPGEKIEARYPGIQAAAEALTLEKLPEILKVMFGCPGNTEAAFLEHFRSDPTFDVRTSDKEAALLATAIADYAMIESDIGGEVALAVTTGAVGGMRPLAVTSGILDIADQALTEWQEQAVTPPQRRSKLPVPDALKQTIAELKEIPASHQHLPQFMPAIITALEKVVTLAINALDQAAKINNGLLDHIAMIEDETRAHWWVVGGFSSEADGFFRDLEIAKAAVLTGWELAEKHSAPLGLHAAPALFDLVLERGRRELSEMALAAVPKSLDAAWRKANFEVSCTGPLAPLLPVSTMLGLAAACDDEDDWKPSFKRKTGIDPEAKISPLHLAVQIYRERLVRKLLKA
jgi:hypothetical protein